MDSNNEIYEIEFTKDCKEEIMEIYEYISKKLVEDKAAKRLMQKMRKMVMELSKMPKIYAEIPKKSKGKKNFRRMIVNNYVILYTIDEENKKVYISHMHYGKSNYLS